MDSIQAVSPYDSKVIRVIRREEKGLAMVFHPTCVVKSYDIHPTLVLVKDRDRRFMSEVAAYQRFNELNCPFVPQLIDFSIKDRWLSIARIRGDNLLVLCLSQKLSLPIKSILAQIDQMNAWLRKFEFGDIENNLKDMILDESGRLYLVDFEPYSPDTEPTARPDIYNALIDDILQRMFVRRGRTAKLTPQFIRLSIGVMSKRPLKTIRFALRYLARGLRHLTRQVFEH